MAGVSFQAIENDVIGNLTLFPEGIFMPIKKAIGVQNSMTKQKKFGWDDNKFPLFENGAGEYQLIESDIASDNDGMIFLHSVGAVDFDLMTTKYDSLTTMFLTISECYKKGVYRYENNKFKYDHILENNLAGKFNPKSEFWKLYEG